MIIFFCGIIDKEYRNKKKKFIILNIKPEKIPDLNKEYDNSIFTE